YIREEIPSGSTSDVMRPHPSGYLIYGADGRMMVIFVHSDRKKPLGAVPNPAESEELFEGAGELYGNVRRSRRHDRPPCRCVVERILDRHRSNAVLQI